LVELLEESKILFEPNADSSEVERVLKEHGDKLALPLVAQQLTRKSPSVHLRALEILKKRKGAGHVLKLFGGKIFFSRQKRSLALRAAASMNAEFKKVGGKLRLVPLAG